MLKSNILKKCCLLCAFFLVFTVSGCLFFDDGYRDTPLEALELQKEDAIGTHSGYQVYDLLSVKELLDIFEFDNIAYIFYISDANTFTMAICKYSKEYDGWIFTSLREDGDLSDSETFYDLKDGFLDKNVLKGLRFNDGLYAYVDGERATVETWNISLNNKEYVVDFWYITGITNDDYVLEFK